MDFETLKGHRAFKKDILDVVFTHCETFYIHCLPADDLVIGQRGLIDKENSEGIILVFGPHSNRNLGWDDLYVFCELQFTKWESIQIPYECISRVFDKSGQIIMQWTTLDKNDFEGVKPISKEKKEKKKKSTKEKTKTSSRVIEVDFQKKRD